MGVKTLLPLEQFIELPAYDERTGVRYELDHGEVVPMPPASYRHELIKNKIAELLFEFLKTKPLGRFFSETGFVIDPESWRVPDGAFVRADKLAGLDPDKPLSVAPDLAIEIHSPSNSPRVLSRKIAHYREAGAHTVWVIYPEHKEIHVVEPAGERWLTEADTLDAPELLPGFSLSVAALFA